MKKLTISQKNKITKQWAEEFPSLGIYKSMWLLRRVGPLLQGICLDRDSSNSNYLPTFHVHNLAIQESKSISLTLYNPLLGKKNNYPERISMVQHELKFAEFVGRFRSQAPLNLSGDFLCDRVLDAYNQYIKRGGAETTYPLNQYHDMLCVLIWCQRFEEANAFLDGVRQQILDWPPKATQYIGERIKKFFKLQCWIDNPHEMRNSVDLTVSALKLDHLPCSNLTNGE